MTDSKKTTVMITGGAGFIGSHLAETLLDKGFYVIAVDNLITGRKENILPLQKNPRFSFHEMDINDSEFIDTFQSKQIDYIYHLACPTGVPNIERLCEEMHTTCSVGTKNVIDLARTHKSKILFASTAEIYGQPRSIPILESDNGDVNPVGARSPYEEGKRFSESLLTSQGKKYGLEVRIVRIFNTYGPNMSPDDTRVIPNFLRKISDGEKLVIYGNGEQTRTFLYVDDLVGALMLVMEKGTPGEVYNAGGSGQVTMKELAESVINATKHKAGIEFKPHFIEDHDKREPSVEKLMSLGWKQTIPLEKGISRVVKKRSRTLAKL